jgi:cell division protein FtsA
MAKQYACGIDVGDSAVKVIVAEIEKGRAYPRLLTAVKNESRGFHKGSLIDVGDAREAVREAIAAAEKSAGIRIREAYATASCSSLTSHTLEANIIVSRADSEIADLDVRRLIENAAAKIQDKSNREILDVIPLFFKVDGKKIMRSPLGMKGTKLEGRLLFISALKHDIDDLVSVIESAHVLVDRILPAPYADSFVAVSRPQKMAGCAVIDIGKDTTSCAVFEEGTLFSIETFDVGSQNITNDIALGFKVPLDEAERIKTERTGRPTPDKNLITIVEARLSDIFELVDKHLKKIGKSELLPAGAILVGGGSALPHIETFASEYLNLPARTALPLMPSALKLSAAEDGERSDLGRLSIKDPSFAGAYGLVAWAHNPPTAHSLYEEEVDRRSNFSGIMRLLRNFLP